MSNQSYTYDQAHAVINGFMDGSGIREFCTKKCGGHCCQACSTRCNGVRRITCSLFLCEKLRKIIFGNQKGYNSLKEQINPVIVKLLIKERYNQVDWDAVKELSPIEQLKWKLQSDLVEIPEPHYTSHSEWVRSRAIFDHRAIDAGISMMWDDLKLTPDQIDTMNPTRVRED